MLDLLAHTGKFKIPVKAFRTHASEFVIYVTDFPVQTKWEDIYSSKVCMLNVRPTKRIVEDLKYLLELHGYHNYLLVEVTV